MKLKWTLNDLKSELKSRPEIKSWILTQENVHRRERYFLKDKPETHSGHIAIDQDRDTESQSISVKIFVRSPLAGRQGEIAKNLFPLIPLKHQIDLALEAAKQTDMEAWDLPSEIPSDLPELKSADPQMSEDLGRVMNELTGKLIDLAGRERNSRFNSAELFLSVHDRELHLSNGLIRRQSSSRIYAEAAYSAEKGAGANKISDEYVTRVWSVGLKDLVLEKIFDETAELAEKTLDVQKPDTGSYPVIVSADVLLNLFGDFLPYLSATSSYLGFPFKKPGEPLIPGANGDLVTLTLNPLAELAAGSTVISDQGIPQKPLELVKENQILTTIADKQYSDYLKLRPTTTRGSIEVKGGSSTYNQMTQSAPVVVEILQFSALFTNPTTGTFGSEIRLARVFDNRSGKVSYIKGGSLSGSIFENMSNARFSKDLVRQAEFSTFMAGDRPSGIGYYGPSYALLNDVSIVG